MTIKRTDNQKADELLDRAGQLQHAVAPERDLWPGIESQLGAQLRAHRSETRSRQNQTVETTGVVFLHRWRTPLALAASLMLAVLLGYWIGREEAPIPGPTPGPMPIAVQPTPGERALQPVSLEEVGLLEARRTMAADIEAGLTRLPPDARIVVMENLAAINAALDEIDAVLAEAPVTGLDRQLLVSMYADQISRLNSMQALVMNSNQEILL